jgi:hypothetical protein
MLKTVSSVTNALGALVYQGTWDASANSPTLTSSVGTKGNYYVVSVAGTTTLNGISSWSVGDWAVFNGSIWQKVDGGTSESFFNLTVTGTANISTGNVVNMTSSNVTITGGTENAVTYTNVTISSGNITVTNDNVAYSNISTALRTQSLTGYLYGNANTGNVSASTSIPVANVTGAVSSVTGTSPISSSGGTTPAISLNTSGVTAASYGGAANSATITVDTYGRITAASNTAIAIANTQVSGLGTMSTQNANSVSITGGNVGANLSTSTAIPVANATGTLATTHGGTGLTSFTANGVIYATSTSALTTGTALTFDGTNLSVSGNVVQATAAKGINFTANTPASGMTSQLLNWYEEGTWTPTLTGSSSNPTVTYGLQRARYTRVGRLVTVECYISWSAFSGGSGDTYVSGLPFTVESSPGAYGAAAIAQMEGVTFSTGRTAPGMLFLSNTTSLRLTCFGSGVSAVTIPTSSIASSGDIIFTGTYSV